MENWIRRFKDYSTSLDSAEVSSAKHQKELPCYKRHQTLKIRSVSNYGKGKNTDKLLDSMLDDFGVEPVIEEKGDDMEEERHKIHKFKLFSDKKEDLLLSDSKSKNWPKNRSKSTEMWLPKVVELREEEKPLKDKKRKLSVRRSNKWLTDKSENLFELANLKHSDSKSLFNAESNITIEEEDQCNDEDDSEKDTISCFSAPNPIKNRMVDEVDCYDRDNDYNDYNEIREIIEEMSETEQEEVQKDHNISSLKDKRKQLKILLRSTSKSDLVCLYLLPNPKYSFSAKNEQELEVIPENIN